MAPSARATGGALLALTAVCPVLAGCDSTKTQSARAKLAATREVSSREPQLVTTPSGRVEVGAPTLLRDRRSTAVVVPLVNRSGATLTDVPITVGVTRRGKEVVFNKAPELGWFQTHVPAIPANGSTTWVFQSPPGRGSKAGDEPFARVGEPANPAISDAEELPVIRTQWMPAGGDARAPRFGVQNVSNVPQVGLQVYAFAKEGDRYVAAGAGTLADLPAESTRSLPIRLSGDPGDGPFTAIAIPTVFR
ncbi:MAG: hypothetical protein Q7T55_26045 [Solirubrobacteraceae bacterium]|nr:hypothetical protein [Solirubrobacteraceae bacterium]